MNYQDTNIKKEPIYPPLPPVLQKQVDDYLEREKKMKEEKQEKEKVDREIPDKASTRTSRRSTNTIQETGHPGGNPRTTQR